MARIKPQALLQQSKKKKGPSGLSVTTIAIYALVVIVAAFFLIATYRYWTQRSKFQTVDLPSLEKFNVVGGFREVDVPKYAVINTSKGSITVELYKESSPEIVDQFVKSCHKGRFKNMLFNLVIKNFVIRGGDVIKPGTTEDWVSRGKHYNQLETSLKHEAFMLGTSKAKHGGEGFDLFITTAPIPDLSEKLNVFGRVIKGEDVVQEIEEADTDEFYRPKTSIRIIGVTLKEKI